MNEVQSCVSACLPSEGCSIFSILMWLLVVDESPARTLRQTGEVSKSLTGCEENSENIQWN